MKTHPFRPALLLCMLAAVLGACITAPQDGINAEQGAMNSSSTATTQPESPAQIPTSEPEPKEAAVSAPEAIAASWAEALAAGDIDAALSYLAEDAAVSILPPGPDGDGVYNGQAEIRGWYETIVAAQGIGALSDCKADGANLTCLNTYTDEGLKEMGVDFIEGEWAAVIGDGKIQAYTFTISPDSLAKFPPPPEEPTAAPTETAQPTPEPETLATKPEDIQGKWQGKAYGDQILLNIYADGTLAVKWVDSNQWIASNRYSFEDSQLVIHGDDACETGYWRVYVTRQNGAPTRLRFELVEDTCVDRKTHFLEAPHVRVEP